MICEFNVKAFFKIMADLEEPERATYITKFMIDAVGGNISSYSWLKSLEEMPAPKKKKGSRKVYNEGYTEEFEEFWKHYPKKQGKGTAYTVWASIKIPEKTLLKLCLAALQWQNDLWQSDSFKYAPKPDNWLSARRWEDEPPRNYRPQQQRERFQDMDGNWRER